MKSLLLCMVLLITTQANALNLSAKDVMVHLSPEMASMNLEPESLATEKSRNFNSFRTELKAYQCEYINAPENVEVGYHCFFSNRIRDFLIANIDYATELNDYYEQNYLYEALLKSFTDEAIKNKCEFTD